MTDLGVELHPGQRPLIILIFALLVGGCSRDEPGQKPVAKVVHRESPQKATSPPKPRPAIKQVTRLNRQSQLIAQLGDVQGTVKLKSRPRDVVHPAGAAEKLFLGSQLDTEKKGRVELAIRNLGTVALEEESRLVISPVTGNGAVLVRGALRLSAPHPNHGKPKSYLHTTAVAVWTHKGGQALIAVAEDGQVWVAAVSEPLTYIDIEGHQHLLPPRMQITFASDGKPGQAERFVQKKSLPKQPLNKWFATSALAPADRPSAVDKMLLQAEKRADRLTLDVKRLLELMSLNQKISAERKQLMDQNQAPASSPSNTRFEQLSVRLLEQAKEMVDLKEKGLLQMQRIIALIELARYLRPKNADVKRRILSLNARLQSMKDQLPPLFE